MIITFTVLYTLIYIIYVKNGNGVAISRIFAYSGDPGPHKPRYAMVPCIKKFFFYPRFNQGILRNRVLDFFELFIIEFISMNVQRMHVGRDIFFFIKLNFYDAE